MSKNLYLVTFIRQDNGEVDKHYVLAESADRIEEEYADWTTIESIMPLEEL